MRDGGQVDAIVMNASTSATDICDMLGAYGAYKSGVRMVTKSLIDEPAVRADVLANTPAGRLGKPDDIAQMVTFLCSEASGYITGAEILIDGGQTLHGYPRWFSADYRELGADWTPHSS